MEFRKFLLETKEKSMVFAIGRMNPPTRGHEKLVNNLHSLARKYNADHKLLLTHSHDSDKNPLSPEQKLHYAKKAFPETSIITTSRKHPSFLNSLSKIHKAGYKHLHVLAGEDRLPEYKRLINKYNGKESSHGGFNFPKIHYHLAGKRDDSDSVEGISGTKMRSFAQKNDFKNFKANVPSKMDHSTTKALFNDVKKGLIKEAIGSINSNQPPYYFGNSAEGSPDNNGGVDEISQRRAGRKMIGSRVVLTKEVRFSPIIQADNNLAQHMFQETGYTETDPDDHDMHKMNTGGQFAEWSISSASNEDSDMTIGDNNLLLGRGPRKTMESIDLVGKMNLKNKINIIKKEKNKLKARGQERISRATDSLTKKVIKRNMDHKDKSLDKTMGVYQRGINTLRPANIVKPRNMVKESTLSRVKELVTENYKMTYEKGAWKTPGHELLHTHINIGANTHQDSPYPERTKYLVKTSKKHKELTSKGYHIHSYGEHKEPLWKDTKVVKEDFGAAFAASGASGSGAPTPSIGSSNKSQWPFTNIEEAISKALKKKKKMKEDYAGDDYDSRLTGASKATGGLGNSYGGSSVSIDESKLPLDENIKKWARRKDVQEAFAKRYGKMAGSKLVEAARNIHKYETIRKSRVIKLIKSLHKKEDFNSDYAGDDGDGEGPPVTGYVGQKFGGNVKADGGISG